MAKCSVAMYRELWAAAEASAFWQVGCLEGAANQDRVAAVYQDVEHGGRLGSEALDVAVAEAVVLAPALVGVERAIGGLYRPFGGGR